MIDPEHVELRERVAQAFEGQAFMGFLGARLSHVAPGECEIVLPFSDTLTQQHGLFHGGVVATLADNAGGFAAYSRMAPDEQPLSVEFKLNLMRKARGDQLRARARVVQNGRTLKVSLADVFCGSATDEDHCGIALVTVMAIRPTPEPD